MNSAILAVGADSGEHAAWALVALELPERRVRLLGLWPVYGEGDLWLHRALAGAAHVQAEGATKWHVPTVRGPCWLETPPTRSRTLAGGKHHTQQSWTGLGRRVGMLEMAWYVQAGRANGDELMRGQLREDGFRSAVLVEPAHWWGVWRPFGLALRPKTDRDHGAGVERIEQASEHVEGARWALQDIPATRAVDCAESILIAGAAALSRLAPAVPVGQARSWRELTPPPRAP